MKEERINIYKRYIENRKQNGSCKSSCINNNSKREWTE